MRRCRFCGRELDVVLWVSQESSAYPVPCCRECAAARGLTAFPERPAGTDLPEQASCRCCGRALPSPGSWPLTVWVRGRGELMPVCNACRVEYALEPVFASVPPSQAPPDEGGQAFTA